MMAKQTSLRYIKEAREQNNKMSHIVTTDIVFKEKDKYRFFKM